MSCINYLIYILNMPEMFHNLKHSPINYRNCKQPDISSFVDDNYIQVKKKECFSLEQSVISAIEVVTKYMNSNRLAINAEKSKILIVSKNKNMKETFQVQMDRKLIKHSKSVKILGTTMDDNLTWDSHLKKEVIPELKNTICTMKLTTRFMDKMFKREYVNSIFRGKVLFRTETWGALKNPTLVPSKPFRTRLPI